MPLWTDLMTPVEATGIARDEQYLIEQSKGGTLARYLPNVFVDSDHVRFYPGSSGLVDVAAYRAFNAPPEIGKGQGLVRKTIDLPSIARNEPIDEMTQKELARLSDDRIRKSIEAAIRRNVQAISSRQELTRGIAIEQGKVVVDTENVWINDDYGRNAALTITAASLWSTAGVDRITAMNAWLDVYKTYNNGALPGAVVMGSTAWAAYASGSQFATALVGGATRPGLKAEILALAESAGIPPIEVYDRSVSVNGVTTKVLSSNKIYFLPEAVAPDDQNGSLLGATYWGRTVSAGFDSWDIQPDEQPGIVCGVFKDDSVGSSIEVQGDSIGEPVLANANASMTITVV